MKSIALLHPACAALFAQVKPYQKTPPRLKCGYRRAVCHAMLSSCTLAPMHWRVAQKRYIRSFRKKVWVRPFDDFCSKARFTATGWSIFILKVPRRRINAWQFQVPETICGSRWLSCQHKYLPLPLAAVPPPTDDKKFPKGNCN